MWTNKGVKKLFDECGHRVCAISLNNGKTLLIDYNGPYSVKKEDISFDNIDGCDVMVIKHTDISSGKEVKYTSYITTEFIEGIDVMDPEFEDYRIDPLIIK